MGKMSIGKKQLRIQWNGIWREIPTVECEVLEIAEGHYAVSFEGKHFEVFALPDGRLSDGLALDGIELKIETERERIIRERFQVAGPSGTVRTGIVVIKAPMPGLVRALKVSVGDTVERTTTVLVLEAMKMENNILASAAGRVLRVLATESTSVEKNAPLMEIELT
jgi:biotin carboxyl carrier protein